MQRKFDIVFEPKSFNIRANIAGVVILLLSTVVYFLMIFPQLSMPDIEEIIMNCLLFVLLTVVFIVIHEGLHGLGFMMFGKCKTKDIQFGFNKKYFAPYCHCKEPIRLKAYRIALALPTVVLGFIPFLYGLSSGDTVSYFLGTALIIGGIGDFALLWATRKFKGMAFVIDHPTMVGCQIITDL